MHAWTRVHITYSYKSVDNQQHLASHWGPSVSYASPISTHNIHNHSNITVITLHYFKKSLGIKLQVEKQPFNS